MTAFTRRAALRGGVGVGRVEIHVSPCIVAHPPNELWHDILIVPANEFLVGTSLPYFPIGGPVPAPLPAGVTNSVWGGMEAGQGMMYSVQVVDGAVTEFGGHDLVLALKALPVVEDDDVARDSRFPPRRCFVGDAVRTVAAGSLKHNFQGLVHTVAPFRSDEAWAHKLASCYKRCLDVATCDVSKSRKKGGSGGEEHGVSIAVPLLGAGARGAAPAEAAVVAAEAISAWRRDAGDGDVDGHGDGDGVVMRFGVLDNDIERLLQEAFDKCGWGI